MTAVRLDFDGADPTRFGERVRQFLQKRPQPAVIIDLSQVEALTVMALAALGDALQALREKDVEVWIDGPRPPVYKALLVARLGSLCERLPRGAAS